MKQHYTLLPLLALIILPPTINAASCKSIVKTTASPSLHAVSTRMPQSVSRRNSRTVQCNPSTACSIPVHTNPFHLLATASLLVSTQSPRTASSTMVTGDRNSRSVQFDPTVSSIPVHTNPFNALSSPTSESKIAFTNTDHTPIPPQWLQHHNQDIK